MEYFKHPRDFYTLVSDDRSSFTPLGTLTTDRDRYDRQIGGQRRGLTSEDDWLISLVAEYIIILIKQCWYKWND